MNAAQLHLLLNHLPVIVPLIGVALILMGAAWKSNDVREAGLWLIVFGALSAIAVYLSGDPAESILKNYPGVSRLLIEDHSSSALSSLILLEITGAVSLFFAFQSRMKKTPIQKTWAWVTLLLLALVSFGFVARTAHLGGLIRHEEIRTSDRF